MNEEAASTDVFFSFDINFKIIDFSFHSYVTGVKKYFQCSKKPLWVWGIILLFPKSKYSRL